MNHIWLNLYTRGFQIKLVVFVSNQTCITNTPFYGTDFIFQSRASVNQNWTLKWLSAETLYWKLASSPVYILTNFEPYLEKTLNHIWRNLYTRDFKLVVFKIQVPKTVFLPNQIIEIGYITPLYCQIIELDKRPNHWNWLRTRQNNISPAELWRIILLQHCQIIEIDNNIIISFKLIFIQW